MPEPDTDKMLREFLEDARESKRDGHTLRSIGSKIQAHEVEDERRFNHLAGELRGHSLRIGELEKDSSKFENLVEDTGRHQIESLHRALAEEREAAKWWKHHVVKVVSGIIVAILLAAGGIIFGMLLHK